MSQITNRTTWRVALVLVLFGALACLVGAMVGISAASSNDPKGDMNCDGLVGPDDSLIVLKYDAGLTVNLPGGCPALGSLPDGSTPTPTVKPGPQGDFSIEHSSWNVDQFNYVHVYGEIHSGLNDAADLVKVTANFYSASDQLLATDYTFSCLNVIPSGGISPFSLSAATPSGGFDHLTLRVTDYSSPPFLYGFPDGLMGRVDNTYLDTFNEYHAVGTVSNTSSNTYKSVRACVAIYNGQGNVVSAGSATVNPGTLSPGVDGTFDYVDFPPAGINYDHVAAWADASYFP